MRATNREESYPKNVTHGPKSLSRYNDIVVSRIVIKGFYCNAPCNTYENELSVDAAQPFPASP